MGGRRERRRERKANRPPRGPIFSTRYDWGWIISVTIVIGLLMALMWFVLLPALNDPQGFMG